MPRRKRFRDDRDAKIRFLKVVEAQCPHVLRSLRSRIFPLHHSGDPKKRARFLRDLYSWFERYHFVRSFPTPTGRRYEKVEWITREVWATLNFWKFRSVEGDWKFAATTPLMPSELRFGGRIRHSAHPLGARIEPGLFRYDEEPWRTFLRQGYTLWHSYLIEDHDEDELDKLTERIGRQKRKDWKPLDPFYETVLIPTQPPKFPFEFPAYDPVRWDSLGSPDDLSGMTRNEWRKKCEKAFAKAVIEHLKGTDLGALPSGSHFVGAVLSICGENGDGTYGWFHKRIRDHFRSRGDAMPRPQALRRLLRDLGFPPRSGRPQHAREHRPRHIAK